MKIGKIICLIYFSLFSLIANATNNLNYTFNCDQLKVDGSDFGKLRILYYSIKDYKNWAVQLNRISPLSPDNTIYVDYIITCDNNFDIDKAIETTTQWLNYSFSSTPILKQSDDNSITSRVFVNKIADYNYFSNWKTIDASVSVDVNLKIRFKENRIRFEGYIKYYKVSLVDFKEGLITRLKDIDGENNIVNIETTYPFKKNSDNQYLYAMSFVNSTYWLIEKTNEYIRFLNKNFNIDINTEEDDNW